jgi:hypothetical protein
MVLLDSLLLKKNTSNLRKIDSYQISRRSIYNLKWLSCQASFSLLTVNGHVIEAKIRNGLFAPLSITPHPRCYWQFHCSRTIFIAGHLSILVATQSATWRSQNFTKVCFQASATIITPEVIKLNRSGAVFNLQSRFQKACIFCWVQKEGFCRLKHIHYAVFFVWISQN